MDAKHLRAFYNKVELGNKERDECDIWTGCKSTAGYGQFRSFPNRSQPSHAAILEHFEGPPPEGMEACHSCPSKDCVNPDHLRWGSHAENMNEALAKPFLIGKIRYERQKDAAQYLGVWVSEVSRRLGSSEFPEYKFV